jgi:Cys-tRNA(Pro)/Cys-tRNA(Cys) deacylase
MSKKLNSMRLLDQHKVPYEPVEFDDSIHDASLLAQAVGVPAFVVYKTLVVDTGEKKPLLALIAAHRKLDLKKLAKAAGFKKLAMATHANAEKWTGLKTGGISPLMLIDKNWRVFIDQPVTELPQILLSAGQRGLNLRVATSDLMRVLSPVVADISITEAG